MPPSKRRKIDPPSVKLLNKSKGNKPANDGEASFHRFLDLPAELRNQIYSYVVQEDEHIELRWAGAPLITHASKQLRAEAFPVYFAKNSFMGYLCTNINKYDHLDRYNCSGPQFPYYWKTTDPEAYKRQVNAASKSGTLRAQRWLHSAPSRLVTFRDIRLIIELVKYSP